MKTRPKGNSGIFFHTTYQAKGIPAKGFEFQINNTGSDQRYRTGAIYPTKPLDKVLLKDDEWFECHLSVRGNKVVLKVNGETTHDVEFPLMRRAAYRYRVAHLRSRVTTRAALSISAVFA